MTEHYQYTESGLHNIYLVNGFEFVEDRLRIHDLFGLHRAIGQWLVSTRKNLSGGEIRFLRHELEMSHASLARLLGVSEQSVLRWEKKRNSRDNGNPAAERALCLIYLNKALGERRISEALEAIVDLGDELDLLGEFSFYDTNKWHENATT